MTITNDPTTWPLAAFALLGVLGLILLLARGARSLGLGGTGPRPGRRLGLQEVLPLDGPPPGPRALRRARGALADRRRAGRRGRLAGRVRGGRAVRRALLLLAAALLLLAPGAALAQSVSIDLGAAGQPGATARLVQLTALIGVLSLAPSLLVMLTAFARIVIVLSLLRSAIGAQGIPPNPVLIGLALFLTLFVMQPVFEASWAQGLAPLAEGRVGEIPGLQAAAEPFRRFMAEHVREPDLALFLDLAGLAPPAAPDQAPWRALVPAFMVGELKRAFEIGFLLFLPFLVIDMVVASLLMSLGMMMLPPTVVSLPFKLIFFVLVDGWRLVAGSLVQGFAGT